MKVKIRKVKDKDKGNEVDVTPDEVMGTIDKFLKNNQK